MCISCIYLFIYSFLYSLAEVAKYSDMLDRVVVKDENGLNHIPELYYVPADKVSLGGAVGVSGGCGGW